MGDVIADARAALERAIRDFGEAAMTFGITDPVAHGASLAASKEAQQLFVAALAAGDAHALEKALAVLDELGSLPGYCRWCGEHGEGPHQTTCTWAALRARLTAPQAHGEGAEPGC